MLVLYAVVKEIDCKGFLHFDFLSFYLRRSDADTYVKERNVKGLKVVPAEVNETYESKEE